MVKLDKLPVHLAVIMDGNGRWAKKRGLPRNAGHRAGVTAVRNTVENTLEYGIEYLTFFAFSTENWKRDQKEIDGIFKLLEEYIDKDHADLHEKNIKVLTIGDITKLPASLYKKIEDVKKETKNNTGLKVCLALNYGGIDELVRAVNLVDKKTGEINRKDIEKHLYTTENKMPPPDFIIRTSGEMRLSNFMLFQAAYSELYFPKCLWPDFNKKELNKALLEYSKRARRFGGY